MERINHITMLERFFKELNEFYNTQIDLNNFYSVTEERKRLSNIEFSKKSALFIRNCLPYTIQHLNNNKYIFLNREYKPLGVFGYSNSVNYEDFEFLAFTYEKDDIHRIYFHSDRNRPQDSRKNYIDYLVRLKKFLIDYKNNDINTTLNKYFYRYIENLK